MKSNGMIWSACAILPNYQKTGRMTIFAVTVRTVLRWKLQNTKFFIASEKRIICYQSFA